MCGLVTIVGYAIDAPPVERGELLAIRDSMAARGPDGARLWSSRDGLVGLAHRRLSLLDVSEAGAQPMASEDGSLQIVFNGEIYNYRELRSALQAKHYRFRSDTDTEVLIHLYADRGLHMVHALRGMYAFVIWDDRHKRVFAARDPLGIKPLYYADDGTTLRIASQVKALIAGKAVIAKSDSAGQVGFLLFGYIPEPFTIYQTIRSIPAGAWLIAERGKRPTIRHFCRIEDELTTAAQGSDQLLPAGERRARLRAALLDSVQRHLVADVPVGVFLSAGIDSSVVTALASEFTQTHLRTITLGSDEYRGTDNDETLLAAITARHYATKHQTHLITQTEFTQELDRVIAAMDQPSIDGVNTYFVAKAAHKSGLKAALSGIGGDELFGGYPSFSQVPRIPRTLVSITPHWLGKALRVASAPVFKRFTSPKYAGLLEYGRTQAGAYLLRRALHMPWEIEAILDPHVAREGWEQLQVAQRLEETVRSIRPSWLQVSALELVWYMRNQLLRDSDWAGMASSLEIRTPLADIEVLRAVAGISARRPPRKRDLSDLPLKPLPSAIVERRKTGFAVPVQEWTSATNGPSAGRGLRGWAMRLTRAFNFELRERPRPKTRSLSPSHLH